MPAATAASPSTNTETAHRHNPSWTWAIPLVSWTILGISILAPQLPGLALLLCAGLMGGVVCAIHHAEVIALKVGEPFGTLVLALSVTTIEVALIVSMMMSGDPIEALTLPRDTIFAALMIIINGIIGLSLLVGGRKHGIQRFHVDGMSDALCTMVVITSIALVLPNYIGSAPDGTYSPRQLIFVACTTLVLFMAFTHFQTMGHRDYFVPIVSEATAPQDADAHAPPPDARTTGISVALLLVSLVAVVLCAKSLSPTLEGLLQRFGAPAATLGILIAAIVLLPEFGAAMRNAALNRLQSSLNLAIGSAIASIGLTIPAVALLAVYMGWPLQLGLDAQSTMLLVLSTAVLALPLNPGHPPHQPRAPTGGRSWKLSQSSAQKEGDRSK